MKPKDLLKKRAIKRLINYLEKKIINLMVVVEERNCRFSGNRSCVDARSVPEPPIVFSRYRNRYPNLKIKNACVI